MVTGLMARMADQSQQITQRDQAIASKDREILYRQTKIDQLTHEMAVLNRWKFGRSREHSAELKVKMVDACDQPGVSIAGIALANDINDNLARR